VDRTDLQRLTERRLEDARVLLQQDRFGAAYYLCGYVVGCGLKACIAGQIKQYEFPRSVQFARDIFTHDLVRLVTLAEMTDSLESQKKATPKFALNWSIATKWSEQSRYEDWSEPQARELFDAVSDEQTGVLAWIRGHW
jgi:hypothetical protein